MSTAVDSNSTTDSSKGGAPNETKTPAVDQQTDTSTPNRDTEQQSSPPQPCSPCKVLIPISTAVLAVSIIAPIIQHICCDDSDQDDDRYDEDEDDQMKQNPISQAAKTFWTKIANVLRLNEDSNLSSGPNFTVKEYSVSESV